MKKICPQHGIYTTAKCPECSKQNAKSYDTTRRDKKMKDFYNSKRWRDTSAKFLQSNPLCCECSYPATMTDHIEEIKDGGSKYDWGNLQPMCKPCHNTKTAKEKRRRGGGAKSLELKSGNAQAPSKFLGKPFSGDTL